MHAHTATIEGVKTLVYQTNNNKTLLADRPLPHYGMKS